MRLVVRAACDRSAIASRPNGFKSLDLKSRRDLQATVGDGQVEGADEPIRLRADRPDDRLGHHDRPVAQGDTVGAHLRGFRVEAHIDVALDERSECRRAEHGMHLGQQAIGTLQQRQFDIAWRDLRVVAHHALHAVGQCARHFDAGKSAAEHDEMAEARAPGGIILEFDPRETTKHGVPNVHRVADRLERKRVRRHARHEVELRADTEGEDEVIVGKGHFAGQRATGHRLCHGVDPDDAAHHEAPAPVDSHRLTERRHDMLGKHRRSNRLRQHRIIRGVTFLADEEHLAIGHRPAQKIPREADARKAPTDHDDRRHARENRNEAGFDVKTILGRAAQMSGYGA